MMSHDRTLPALFLAVAATLAGSPHVRADELRTFTGQITPDNSNGEGGEKTFRLHLLIPSSGDAPRVLWLLEDNDPHAPGWWERFGETSIPTGDTAGVAGPSIALEYGDGSARIPLLVLGPRGTDMRAGLQWEVGGLRHEVTGNTRVRDIAGWHVSSRNNFGEKRAAVVDEAQGAVLALRETVFVGQGRRHRMTLELEQRESLAPDVSQHMAQIFQQLTELRGKLGWTSESPEIDWNSEHLAQARASLGELEGVAETDVLRKFVQTALKESNAQRQRAGALDSMRRKALSQKLPTFQFQVVSGKPLARQELDHQVAVLHFWDYRDTPLREPYGQVGYLDYLYRKYESQGVRFAGIVSNQQSETAGGQQSAKISARKFASFMNLAYPLYQDGGQLLKQIGDPRLCDSSLPLFVVIDRTGQIRHYSAGYYKVDANQGLVELESAIKQALESGE